MLTVYLTSGQQKQFENADNCWQTDSGNLFVRDLNQVIFEFTPNSWEIFAWEETNGQTA